MSRVTCRGCGQSFAAPEHLWGQSTPCPSCTILIAVPHPPNPNTSGPNTSGPNTAATSPTGPPASKQIPHQSDGGNANGAIYERDDEKNSFPIAIVSAIAGVVVLFGIAAIVLIISLSGSGNSPIDTASNPVDPSPADSAVTLSAPTAPENNNPSPTATDAEPPKPVTEPTDPTIPPTSAKTPAPLPPPVKVSRFGFWDIELDPLPPELLRKFSGSLSIPLHRTSGDAVVYPE